MVIFMQKLKRALCFCLALSMAVLLTGCRRNVGGTSSVESTSSVGSTTSTASQAKPTASPSASPLPSAPGTGSGITSSALSDPAGSANGTDLQQLYDEVKNTYGEHYYPTRKLSPAELEETFGRIIRGCAYPDSGIRIEANGSNYEGVKSFLTAMDIVYARTLAGDNDGFELPADWHAWMPSAHHNNPHIFEYVDKFLAINLNPPAYHAARHPRLFYVWGHSHELDRDNNWDRMEQICERLSGHPDIWYATNIEIYDYVEGYKRLVYSADGHKIYNPSLFDIWIDVDFVVHKIPSGATVTV
jgi:hypothetical protein